MADIVKFPNESLAVTPRVDPPESDDLRRVILELEHEVAELMNVVAEQAVKLHHESARSTLGVVRCPWLQGAALLIAFVSGWVLDPLPSFSGSAHAAKGREAFVIPVAFSPSHRPEEIIAPFARDDSAFF